jgi:hypothetical protein
MPDIAEQNIFIREHIKLPDGLILTTDGFREGWRIARTTNVSQLEKQIILHGWNMIEIDDAQLRYGVGDTSEEAMANAYRIFLGHASEVSNVVKVENIELTQYPWFFLAKVQTYPFRIQQSALPPASDHCGPRPAKPRQRRLPSHAGALYPQFGSAIPLLKQMLTSSRTVQTRPQ